MFDLIVGWQAPPLGMIGFNESNMQQSFGNALTYAVMPFVELDTLGSERIERLLRRTKRGTIADYIVVSLPHIVRLDRAREKRVIEQILKAVFSRRAEAVVSGLVAIERWRLLSRTGALHKVPLSNLRKPQSPSW